MTLLIKIQYEREDGEIYRLIKSYIGYIAPIETVSDREQETLALEAYKAFIGEEEVHKYTSKAVFEGFDL